MPVDRRSFMKGAGVAAGAAVLPGVAAGRIDDKIDLDGGVQEIIVVFERREDVELLEEFDLPDGFHTFDALPYGYTRAEGEVIESIAEVDSVRWIDYNHEIELHNETTRELTGAAEVHARSTRRSDFDVTGDGIHVAMIDSGLSPHPDIIDKIEHNYRYVNPLRDKQGATWVDAGEGDIDDIGHGTHVAGTFGGDGEMSNGQYAGTGRGIDKITSYRVDGPSGFFVNTVSALDHLLAKQRDGEVDVQLINNSWGWSRYGDFNPKNAANLAFWELFKEGVLPLFSAGNDADFDTLNPYARAPYVATVAATFKPEFGEAKATTGFSSQGRPPEEATGEGGFAEGFELDYETSEGAHYDRKTALENVQQFHADDPTDAPEVDADYETTVSGEASSSARVPLGGTFELDDPGTAEWSSPADAGILSAIATWEPRNQSIEVVLYRKDDPNNEVGGPYPANVNDGETVIEFDAPIEPETDYVFEFRGGEANVEAEVTVEIEVLENVSEVDGPMGVYRPAVGAPGDNVISTLPPSNVLWPLAPALFEGGQPTEPFYDALSGTSMSCPATTGVAALVYDAYEDVSGFYPKPVDVINILEVTANGGTDQELPSHHEANIGAGFVDAVDAVDLARKLAADVADQDGPESDAPADVEHPGLWDEIELCSFAPDGLPLSLSGAVEVDSSVYTAGQTSRNRIELSVDQPEGETVYVRDRVPAGWDVDEAVGDMDAVVPDGDGGHFFVFGVENPQSAYDELAHFTQAPDDPAETGEYTFGPVSVSRETDVEDPDFTELEWRLLDDSERDVVVAGADT